MNFLHKEKQTSAEMAIVEAIVFFDMFDFPLTDLEIWKFMMAKSSFADAQKALSSNYLADYLERKNSFYFLRGRESIVSKRLEKYGFADRKFKRALRVAGLFTCLPWIKMIAIGNLIGPHNLKDDGDIDLFIITEKGKLWTTRFFTVLFMKLLGLRPKKSNTRDKICLSFFVSEEALSVSDLMLDKDDYYFVYWLAGLTPIYGHDFYNKFIGNNNWIYGYLPNWTPINISQRRQAKRAAIVFSYISGLFDYLEWVLKNIQIKIMPKDLREKGNRDTRVIFNDKILKLHSNDRRQEYRERFIDKMRKYENIKQDN